MNHGVDAFVGMCRLADFGHRVTKISQFDQFYVSKLIRAEEAREVFNKKTSVTETSC